MLILFAGDVLAVKFSSDSILTDGRITPEDEHLMSEIVNQSETNSVVSEDEKFQLSQQALKKVYKFVKTPIIITGPDLKIVSVNDSAVGLLGQVSYKIIGKSLVDFLDKEGGADFFNGLQDAAINNTLIYKCYTSEYVWEPKIAEYKHERITQDKKKFYVFFITPIDLEKRLSEERNDFALGNSLSGVIMADHKGKVLYTNSAVSEMFGWDRHYMVGKNVKIFVGPMLQAKHDERIANYWGKQNKDLYYSPIIGKVRLLKASKADGNTFEVLMRLDRYNNFFVASILDFANYCFRRDYENIKMQRTFPFALLRKHFGAQQESASLGKKAIFVLDLVNSSEKTLRYGTDKMCEVTREISKELANRIKIFQGNVIKGTGDGIMAIFDLLVDRGNQSLKKEIRNAIYYGLNCFDWAKTRSEEDKSLYEMRIAIGVGDTVISKYYAANETFDAMREGPIKAHRICSDPDLSAFQLNICEVAYEVAFGKKQEQQQENNMIKLSEIFGNQHVVNAKGFEQGIRVFTAMWSEEIGLLAREKKRAAARIVDEIEAREQALRKIQSEN